MNKEAIRRHILALREKQSLVLKRKKDARIASRLSRFSVFARAGELFIYVSHRGEVSTDVLIKKYFQKKKIIVPKFESDRICLYELKSRSAFQKGPFGIREPVFCLRREAYSGIDAAIIPGAAFDTAGHRIGFGGGHFDRLLKKLDGTTIGLAYEFQIIDKVPARSYDVPVDYLVTEKRIIQCVRRP